MKLKAEVELDCTTEEENTPSSGACGLPSGPLSSMEVVGVSAGASFRGFFSSGHRTQNT